jgi:hypothetical protein
MGEGDAQFRWLDDYVKQWKRNRQLCGKLDRIFIDWQGLN